MANSVRASIEAGTDRGETTARELNIGGFTRLTNYSPEALTECTERNVYRPRLLAHLISQCYLRVRSFEFPTTPARRVQLLQ